MHSFWVYIYTYSPLRPVNIFKQNKLDTSTKKIINISKINTEKNSLF